MRAIESSINRLVEFEVFCLDSMHEELSAAISELAPQALIITDGERIPEATRVVAANPGLMLMIFDPLIGKLTAAEYREYPARTQDDVIQTLHTLFESQEIQTVDDLSGREAFKTDVPESPC
jgi:hypothetical protein